jgi:hypothetical protein
MPRVIACAGPVGTTRTRHPQQEQKETASQEDLHVGARDLLSRPLATLLPDVKRCDNGEVGILVVWPVSAQSVFLDLEADQPVHAEPVDHLPVRGSPRPLLEVVHDTTAVRQAGEPSIRPPRLGPEVGSEIARYDIIGDRLTAP